MMEEKGYGTPRSGFFPVNASDLKKGAATGVIDGESITVSIKAITKDPKAHLGRNLVEDEWGVWARIPVGDDGQVLEVASELCRQAPQLGEGALRDRASERGGDDQAADRRVNTPASRGHRGPGWR